MPEPDPKSTGDGKHDFFVSYTGTDERWATWIASEVEAAGYRVEIQAWDFRASGNFVHDMHQGIMQAPRLIAVLSPAYFASEFCEAEWAAYFKKDPNGDKHLILPVRIADFEVPGLLNARTYIDLVGLDEAAARKKLLDGIPTGRVKPAAKTPFPGAQAKAAPPFPGALSAIWTVPYPRNPFFTGRNELLRDLRQSLHAGRTVAVTQPVAVHGLGGVGKTQLAVEYAFAHHKEYDAVLWAVADSAETASANFAALVKPLGLPEAEAREQPAQVVAVQRWLQGRDRWLLVFDSVDSPEAERAVLDLLPPALAGHVLITSRRTDWPAEVAEVPVNLMAEEIAVKFLLDRVGKHAKDAGGADDARVVARALGCLPLALEQAAAYVGHCRITFREYLRRLEQSRVKLLHEKTPGLTRHPASVAETWLLSEQQLNVTARAILRLTGFLAPDDIPRSLYPADSKVLAEAVKALETEIVGQAPRLPSSVKKSRMAGGAPALQKPVPAEDALVELADHSLITLTPQAYSCHRLVQAVQTDRLDAPTTRRWTELALRLVDDAVPGDTNDVRTWPVMEPLRVHAEMIAAQADQLGITEPTARLMNQLGLFLKAKALHREAEPLYRRALAIDEQSFGPDHPNVAIRLNNLAQLLQATNRLADAEPLMRRALAILERSLGENHPNVASALNNLAQLLQATNRLKEAEPLMARVVTIFEKSFGENHPNVATALNNLASLLKATNRLKEAEPLMRRALAIDKQSFGPDHPKVAIRLNNLALLLQDTNRLKEAEPLMRRALAIDEQSFGPDHPEVATDLNNLARLLQDTNRLKEAEPLMRRAVEITVRFKVATGHEHPNQQLRLNNYARLLAAMGRSREQIQAEVRGIMGEG
jgi:tetratricopeptide (TPR) repeat protein